MDSYTAKLIKEQQQSSAYIQTNDLKNRFLRPFASTVVVDDFYDDPDLVREFALGLEFFKGDRGSWPGVRTELLHRVDYDFFSVFSKKILEVLKQNDYTEIIELQTGFQSIDETYGRGWVHDDDPKLNMAGIIYLNPGEVPNGSGTTIYNDAPDFNGERYSEMFMNDVLVASPEERTAFAKYREEQISYFTPNTIVDNVYNRLVMFDSRCWHSADNFFGKDKYDARLTQVFFIKAR